MKDTPKTDRHLPLEGSYNIRDVGGYPTADGRRIRWGTFLRADSLHRLPDSSQRALIDYGVRTVIDLRGDEEAQDEPNVFQQSTSVDYRRQALMGEEIDSELDDYWEGQSAVDGFVRTYTAMLDRRRPQLATTLVTLATSGALPAVVHCHAGKDRTGVVTAVVLALAGVPGQTIVDDYTMSADYLLQRSLDGRAPDFEASYTSEEEYRKNCCPPEAMAGTLEHIDREYGGVEAYVLGSGVNPRHVEALRQALVE